MDDEEYISKKRLKGQRKQHNQTQDPKFYKLILLIITQKEVFPPIKEEKLFCFHKFSSSVKEPGKLSYQ